MAVETMHFSVRSIVDVSMVTLLPKLLNKSYLYRDGRKTNLFHADKKISVYHVCGLTTEEPSKVRVIVITIMDYSQRRGKYDLTDPYYLQFDFQQFLFWATFLILIK
jgi:hypothetical protein